ncbi:hypothetical protein Cgig2_020748 [Carnegiea gigantea]|uniref:Uncharacterized protein n=1 Tax=Carnegiea gigantea TaxID=171969 RepID=A0A9Q1GRW7_9CARY|nr:hypothetical protein Cgig2_020748 [Carnegiea gigantea]
MAMKILHAKSKGETIDLGECDTDEMSALDKEEAKRWKGKVVPPVKNEFQKIARKTWQCDIVPNGYMAFDVIDHEDTNYNVDLNKAMRSSCLNSSGLCLIPTFKRGPTAKQRKRGPEELRKLPKRSRTVRCKNCGGLYHNSATYQGQGSRSSKIIRKRNPLSDCNTEGKRSGGRPRKQVLQLSICEQSSS